MGKLVAYYRVSTRRQIESGLGLEAQEACVADFARNGLREVIASYREIETGKRADQPELAKGSCCGLRADRRVAQSLSSFQVSVSRGSTPMVRGRTYHFRIRLASGNIINTSQLAHDIWQAQALVQVRYPGCVVLQVVNE